MESTQEHVSAPTMSLPGGKPNLTWLVWGAVVLLGGGVSFAIGYIGRRMAAKKASKKVTEKVVVKEEGRQEEKPLEE